MLHLTQICFNQMFSDYFFLFLTLVFKMKYEIRMSIVLYYIEANR